MCDVNKVANLATQKGQSLIEIIVVLLLISICISGTTVTMLKSQQLSRLAVQHSDAMILASSFISKMQRNKHAFFQKQNTYLTQISAQSVIKVRCTQLENCAIQRQALQDLSDLQNQLLGKLPNYVVEICRDDTSQLHKFQLVNSCDDKVTSSVAIKIWWDVPGLTDAESLYYSTSVDIY